MSKASTSGRSAPPAARNTERRRAVESQADETAPLAKRPGGGSDAGAVEPAAKSADTAESERFLAEFTSHWRLHGNAAFDAVCSEDPARYLALAAKLIGRDGQQTAAKNDLVALLASFCRDPEHGHE